MSLLSVKFSVAAAILVLPLASIAGTVFSGSPSQKISEAGSERVVEQIPKDRAPGLNCVINEISGKYYWATRANKEMVRLSSGAFITYVAVDGSGYVRVIDPSAKQAAELMSPTEAKFGYVEHLLLGLRSVTYYGQPQ